MSGSRVQVAGERLPLVKRVPGTRMLSPCALPCRLFNARVQVMQQAPQFIVPGLNRFANIRAFPRRSSESSTFASVPRSSARGVTFAQGTVPSYLGLRSSRSQKLRQLLLRELGIYITLFVTCYSCEYR